MKTKQLAPVADPARRIDLHFSIRYAQCALAEKRIERDPVLRMYLSSHFVRAPETGGDLNIRLREDDRQHCFVGSLVGTLARDQHNDISSTASIGLCSFAVHRNDWDHACYVNVGMTHVPLADVLRDIKAHGEYRHMHDLVMRTVVMSGEQPIKKGTVEVVISKVELGPALKQGTFVQSALSGPDGPAGVATTVMTYVQSCMTLESALPDTLPHTERIRSPMDLSQVGIELTQEAFLPIAAYAHVETPRSNVHYFQNAYERVLARRNLSHAGAWRDFDVREKARTMGAMMCYGVQTFDYIGDAVETGNRLDKTVNQRHVGTEEFSNLWDTLAGDCEDGGRAIYSSWKAFTAVKINADTHPHLVELQQIARQYVPFMTLAVVHGQKIGDTEGFGAHMYTTLIPKDEVNKMLSRNKEGRELLERMGAKGVAPRGELPGGVFPAQAARGIGANASFAYGAWYDRIGTTSAPSYVDAHSTLLPVLFGEGTGHIDTLGYTDPLFDQRRYIGMNMPSVEHFKKEIPHEERAPSPFYYANLIGVTGAISDEHGINVGSFIYGQINDGGHVSRGAFYTDVLAAHERVTLIPHPAYDASTAAIIKEAISLRPPPRALVLDPAIKVNTHNALLQRYVDSVKAMKRQPPAKPVAGSVDLFVRKHNFDEKKIDAMIRDSKRLDRIYDASYEVECITSDVYAYRVRLFVK